MKKKLITAFALTACSAAVQAQTNVTFFGLVDTTIRYSTNENAAGDNKWQMTDGVLTGSRWGVRGTEDLGGGTKAMVVLESGFAPDTGTSGQGGRLFGRQAFVGLDGGFGKVLLGRQYTIAHEALSSFEAFGFANNSIVGYQGGNFTGLRFDNTIKYSKALGAVTVNAGYTFGEVAGDTSANSAKGISAIYSSGPLRAGAVYQVTNNVTSGYFNAVAAAKASQQSVWGLGGSYQAGPAKVYLGYTNSKLDVADYKNDVFYASINYELSPALKLLGSLQSDKLKHPGSDGTRLTSALMLDYFLSKRTDVYVELDYTKLKDGWVGLANNSGLGSANVFGKENRTGLMVGVRHQF